MRRSLALCTLALVAVIASTSSLVALAASGGDGYRYTTDWTTPNTQDWIQHLKHLAGKPEARGLEVGCFEGRSTLWFLDNVLTHPKSRMACIDVFTERIEANFDHNVKRSGHAERVDKHAGYSQDVLRTLPYDSVDFVYIDGCHLASCALTDAVLSWDLLRPGGVMIFDDYFFKINEPPSQRPKLAIDAFMEAFIDQIVVRKIGFQVILQKKADLDEKDTKVGKPIVHDDEWLEKLKKLQRLGEQKRKRQKQQER